MSIIPKLYLNMSPATQQTGSVSFARNMKIDNDGTLVSDYGYKDINVIVTPNNNSVEPKALNEYDIVGHIIGLDNKIYFFSAINVHDVWQDNKIIEYDEIEETASELKTRWYYNGGEIDGYVSTNQSGEKILTIGEYNTKTDVPLKHINLSYCSSTDDESIYTQAPDCSISNLKLTDTYSKTIPSGVYIFFIRYKIREDVFTNWFPCSRPIFAGTSEKTTTLQGGLKYINTHKDSAKSFVFELTKVYNSVVNYKQFQLGFIITHDEATDARIWKTFDIDTDEIYFDYDSVTEANIDDLTKVTYELYNVGNITAFKNKLYIANYKETNFNVDNEISENINNIISIQHTIKDETTIENTYNKVTTIIDNKKYQLSAYDKEKQCYTQGTPIEGGNTIDLAVYLPNYFSQDIENLDKFFDINVSSFAKGDVSEYENIAEITLRGNVSYEGDIAYVSNITNNIKNNAILGKTEGTLNISDNDFSNIGIAKDALSVGGDNFILWHKEGVDGGITYHTHPWHDRGLPYVYGRIDTVPEEHSSYYIGHVIPATKNVLTDSEGTSKVKVSARWFYDEDRQIIKSNIIEAINNKSKLILGYATIYDGTTKYDLPLIAETTKETFKENTYAGTDNDVSYNINDINNKPNTTIVERLKEELRQFIGNALQGIDENGNIVLDIENNIIKVSNISFTFKTCKFDTELEEVGPNDNTTYNSVVKVSMTSTLYNCLLTYNIKTSNINIIDEITTEAAYKQGATLMPLSKYDIYVNLVDNHNIVKNGIKVNAIETNSVDYNKPLSKYVLEYKITNDPDKLAILKDYKAFFISLENVGDIIVEPFDYNVINGIHTLNVIEADALLYNLNDNITIIKTTPGNNEPVEVTNKARYYSSSSTYPTLAFGNCGFVGFVDADINENVELTSTDKYFIKISRSIENKENNRIIKASEYISIRSTANNFVEVDDGFYGSYFCAVKKPSLLLSSKCYVAGNDIYAAERGSVIALTPFNGYITLQDTTTYYIRSNFNLNYLNLSEDITDKIHKIEGLNTEKQVIKTINSATLSYVYELKSMYKDFYNLTYNKTKDTNKIEFNNTIRVSNVLSDETYNNSVFKFEPTDYYNVPTDRGIIVNLFAIGNNIYVHNKYGLYKFDANQTIAATEQDISLKETEPFEAGITQVFDSEFGYGGIDNKESGCITFDSYFFYDRYTNHIFMYSGNGQIQLIDATIYKFLNTFNFINCKTLHDDTNNRVLFEFIYEVENQYKSITLSYNYKSKSFVSITDITLEKAFHSRKLAYCYNKNGFQRLFYTEETDDNLRYEIQDSIFGNAYKKSDITYDNNNNKFTIAVLFQAEQYDIANIDSVSFIGNIIKSNIIKNNTEFDNITIVPTSHDSNPANSFYIITDVCKSNVVTGTINEDDYPDADKHYVPTGDYYKGFKYNKGQWNTNYFRDVLNNKNINNSDNMSLIYGRYFILVFNFNDTYAVKFEDIMINNNIY